MVNGSIITNNGKKIVLDRTFNDDGSTSYTAPIKFKVGVGGDTPSISDTDIDNPIPITGTEDVDDCEAITGWSAGTDSAVSLNTSTFKIGAAGLNLYKSGTSGTVMSVSKTTTSVDYTSKDLWLWVYIADVTDLVASGTALVIRFGSDSSNYYQFDIAIGSLSNGWNYIKKASGDADSTTGSPTITACDYTYIAANTDLAADTIAEGDFVIDDIKVASSDDYTKTFVTGYPVLTESTFESEIRGELTTTQANGYDINSFCIINSDSTPLMFSESVFTADSKSTTDQFLFIVKDRVI